MEVFAEEYHNNEIKKPKDITGTKLKCEHVRGSIIIKDDTPYFECRRCGELY